MKIATVESFTGGLMAAKITSMSGASKYYKGSLISYSNEIKELLGVDTSNGVINKEVALEMALKGKKYFSVDLCISFTGNAGPTAMEDKPVGEVYIAFNDEWYSPEFKGNRNEIRDQAVEFAWEKLQEIMKEQKDK